MDIRKGDAWERCVYGYRDICGVTGIGDASYIWISAAIEAFSGFGAKGQGSRVCINICDVVEIWVTLAAFYAPG